MRTNEQPAVSLDVVVGRNLRRLRESSHLTQDELSRRLRGRGLGWTRPTVAAVELGTKTLDVAELILLSIALNTRTSELLAGDDNVRLNGESIVSARVVRTVLADHSVSDVVISEIETPNLKVDLDSPEQMAKITESKKQLGRLQRLLPEVDSWPLSRWEDAEEAASGEAERKAARKLRAAAVEVSFAAFSRWGRSLTAERDARVADSPRDDTSARSLQALRGHVTRQLLAELEFVLKGSD